MRRQTVKRERAIPDFHGPSYSLEELDFLYEHFGEPSVLACPDGTELPEGVNPVAVMQVLDDTYEINLLEMQAKDAAPEGTEVKIWCGFDALRNIIDETRVEYAVRQELKRRTSGQDPILRRAAATPSLHMWDPVTGVPYLGAEGADSGVIRTRIGENGERISLTQAVRDSGIGGIRSLNQLFKLLKRGANKEVPEDDQIEVDSVMANTPEDLDIEVTGNNGVVRCPICQHAETYVVSRSDGQRKAKSKMINHLRTCKTQPELHHSLYRRLTSRR